VEDGLGRCDQKIGVDCSLATYSRVELAVSKTACRQQGTRYARGGSVKLLGRIMGNCPEVCSETTPDP